MSTERVVSNPHFLGKIGTEIDSNGNKNMVLFGIELGQNLFKDKQTFSNGVVDFPLVPPSGGIAASSFKRHSGVVLINYFTLDSCVPDKHEPIVSSFGKNGKLESVNLYIEEQNQR